MKLIYSLESRFDIEGRHKFISAEKELQKRK